jgi:osmotically-inducible protein OsmY
LGIPHGWNDLVIFENQEDMMNKGLTLIGGIGLGAALMYILDPDRGGRRRALVRDKLMRASNKTSDYVGKTSRDWQNRAQGLASETRSSLSGLTSGESVPDETLVARVQAELGRHPVHHRALEITARDGRVTLRGPALASEVDELISAVSGVRGVGGVDNQLEVHEQAGDIPSLQGEAHGAAG